MIATAPAAAAPAVLRCVYCGARAEYTPVDGCDQCGAHESIVEIAASEPPPAPPPLLSSAAGEIEPRPPLAPTGVAPWDEVLGGGVCPGSSLCLWGPAGSGKTTWAAALADGIATRARGVGLYLSPEMPGSMVDEALRRVRPKSRRLRIAGADRPVSSFALAAEEVLALRPRIVVYDSIQSFDHPDGPAGSFRAIRGVLRAARSMAASLGHVAVLVSQVSADGRPVGPESVLHACDVLAVLSASGELRTDKNRFAPKARVKLSW